MYGTAKFIDTEYSDDGQKAYVHFEVDKTKFKVPQNIKAKRVVLRTGRSTYFNYLAFKKEGSRWKLDGARHASIVLN